LKGEEEDEDEEEEGMLWGNEIQNVSGNHEFAS